jgi:polysaccharide biosynthesis/export protein
MRKIASFIGVGLVFLISLFCLSNEKIICLRNMEDKSVISEDELIRYDIPEYKLHYNDMIDVNIQTVEDLLLNKFNNNAATGNQQMQMACQSGGDVYYFTRFNRYESQFIHSFNNFIQPNDQLDA